jgi:hypothetical protein
MPEKADGEKLDTIALEPDTAEYSAETYELSRERKAFCFYFGSNACTYSWVNRVGDRYSSPVTGEGGCPEYELGDDQISKNCTLNGTLEHAVTLPVGADRKPMRIEAGTHVSMKLYLGGWRSSFDEDFYREGNFSWELYEVTASTGPEEKTYAVARTPGGSELPHWEEGPRY